MDRIENQILSIVENSYSFDRISNYKNYICIFLSSNSIYEKLKKFYTDFDFRYVFNRESFPPFPPSMLIDRD